MLEVSSVREDCGAERNGPVRLARGMEGIPEGVRRTEEEVDDEEDQRVWDMCEDGHRRG